MTKKRCLEDGIRLFLESAFIAILFCFVDVGKINKKTPGLSRKIHPKHHLQTTQELRFCDPKNTYSYSCSYISLKGNRSGIELTMTVREPPVVFSMLVALGSFWHQLAKYLVLKHLPMYRTNYLNYLNIYDVCMCYFYLYTYVI